MSAHAGPARRSPPAAIIACRKNPAVGPSSR